MSTPEGISYGKRVWCKLVIHECGSGLFSLFNTRWLGFYKHYQLFLKFAHGITRT